MENFEFKGSSVEEAIQSGLNELNITAEQAIITVIEKGGFLKKAKVSIQIKEEENDALGFMKDIASILKADVYFDANIAEKKMEIFILGEETDKLVGARGEILNALQYLVNVYVNREKEDFKKIYLECEEYKKRREVTLKNLARRLADKAVRTGQKVKLEPMSAQERRIIHYELHNSSDVDTYSTGNEPNRFLTIVPKNLKSLGDRNFSAPRRERQFNKNDGDRQFGRNDDNRERRDHRSDGQGRRNNFNDRKSGDRNSRPPAKKTSTTFGFGSFLGNSKNMNNEEYEKKKAAFFEDAANKIED